MPAYSPLLAPIHPFEIYEDGNCIRELQEKSRILTGTRAQVHGVQHIGKWRKRVKSFIRFF
jgi:hypothetical protein